jgi:hypothetical protein
MANKRVIIVFFSTMFILLNIHAQTDFDQLLKDFVGADWSTVSAAKEKLENYEEKTIPLIIPLLENNTVNKLKNTGSLIYPGAEKFFGYGQIIDYDIDNISVRAGWLLEEISFNNFGFTGIHMPDEDLIGFIKLTFPEYYNNSTNRKLLETSSVDNLRKIIHDLSVRNAKEWWQRESTTWTRLKALNEALKSYDEKCQVKALFYMRNGDTKCTGLTKDYYIDNISKEIVRLSTSDTKRISENAKLILFDTKFLWLENKSQQLN